MLNRNNFTLSRHSSRTIKFVLVVFSLLLFTLVSTISLTFFQAREVQIDQDDYLSNALLKLELIDSLHDNEVSIQKAVLLHLTATSKVEKSAYEMEISATRAYNNRQLQVLKQLLQDSTRLAVLARFEAEQAAHDTLISHLLDLSREGNPNEALSFNSSVITPEYRQHQRQLTILRTSIRSAARESGQEAVSSVATFVKNHSILLVLTLLVAMVTSMLVRHIIWRLRKDNMLLNAQIEERQQLQKALLESQMQYKMLFDHNPLPLWLLDQNTLRFMEVNEAASQEYGYTKEEFSRLTLPDLWLEEDAPWLSLQMATIDKLSTQTMKVRHKRKDGSIFEVEVKSDALGGVAGYTPRLEVIVNVHERQQALQQLQRSQTQLLEISSSIPGAVFQLEMNSDTRYAFTFISEGVRDLFHISPAEVYATPSSLYRHIHRSDAVQVQQAIFSSFRSLSPLVAVFRIRQPHTDRWKWVQAHGLPTLKEKGRVIWNGTMIDITDQKDAQEQLIASEANLRALLDSSPQAIFLLDRSLNVMLFNAVAKQDVKNMLLKDLRTGQSILEFIDQEMTEHLTAYHTRALQGQTIIYEVGNGGFWHEIALRPVLDPNDKVLAVALSILNISARKLALEKIRRNEEQLARAQHLAHLGNWELDVVRDLLTWSDSVYEIYRVHRQSFRPTPHNALLFIPEEERPLVRQAYDEAAVQSRIASVEHRIILEDGSIRMVHEIVEPEFDSEGRLIMLHGTVQDITARKNTEQEVLRAKNLLQSTLENIPEIIFSADKELGLVYVSPQCKELTGYAEEELLAAPGVWLSTVHKQDRQLLKEQVIPRVLAGERQHCELQVRTKDQQQKWFMLRISPMVNAQGEVYRIDGSASDMTQYKEAEAKRNELTDQLLKQNQNLQQFAYIVSHNLRAPIANILGLTTIYDKHKPESPMNPRVIDNLFKSARLLDTTIRDLNDILTIRSELSKVREEVAFGYLLEDIQDSLSGEIEEAGAAIRADFGEAPTVVAVRSYVHSIMLNLMTNALKYKSPDRKLKLYLKTYTIPNYICLSVTDNGLGIDLSKEKEKVFGLYKRFHSHTDGRGLGLHLVKTQAELLGGKVEVDSQVNIGTTFNVYFRYNV
jgi:PAS domain S-box-containing protein